MARLIEEPTVADLAAGTPDNHDCEYSWSRKADGTAITQISTDNGTVFTLDQNRTGEQKFVVAEGSLYVTLQGDVRFRQIVTSTATSGDIVKVDSRDFKRLR